MQRLRITGVPLVPNNQAISMFVEGMCGRYFAVTRGVPSKEHYRYDKCYNDVSAASIGFPWEENSYNVQTEGLLPECIECMCNIAEGIYTENYSYHWRKNEVD